MFSCIKVILGCDTRTNGYLATAAAHVCSMWDSTEKLELLHNHYSTKTTTVC